MSRRGVKSRTKARASGAPGDRSIKSKLTSMVMLTSVAGLLMACLGFAFYDYSTFRDEKVRELASFAEIIAASSAKSLNSMDADAAGEIVGSLPGDRKILAACLYSAEGDLLTGFVSQEGSETACPARSPVHGHEFAGNRLRLAHPAVLAGKTAGTVLLVAGLDDIWNRMIRYSAISGLVLLASILVAFAASSRLRYLISDPLLKLAKTARTISNQQDFSVRVERIAGGEVGQLTDAFNEMLTQIQARDEELRRAKGELEQKFAENRSLLKQETDGRQQAEEALKEREEALRQSLSSERPGSMESGAARELEGLLSSIKGYAEALASSTAGDDSLDAWITGIRDASRRAAALTGRLQGAGGETEATEEGEGPWMGPDAGEEIQEPGVRREAHAPAPATVETGEEAGAPTNPEGPSPWEEDSGPDGGAPLPVPEEPPVSDHWPVAKGEPGPEGGSGDSCADFTESPLPDETVPGGDDGGVNPLEVPAEETEEELVLSLDP